MEKVMEAVVVGVMVKVSRNKIPLGCLIAAHSSQIK